MGKKGFASRGALKVTLSAVLAALSLIFLQIACMAPAGRVGLVALAGLFPAAAVVSLGFSAGFLCYLGTGILSLLLLPDKGMALLYLLFFGLYPMLKGRIEQLRILPVELILKLLLFNAVLFCFLLLFRSLFFSVVPLERVPRVPLFLLCNGGFLAYDFGFSKIIGFYRCRVDRVLRKA